MRIYMVTNRATGKLYVGQTVQTIANRWRRHCWPSTSDNRMPIALAIKKYGKASFDVEELCACSSQEELNWMEIFYVQLFNTFSPNGYNLRAGNGPGKMSEETKRKISAKSSGRIVSAETRRRLSDSHKGHRVTNETKRKLSTLLSGRIASPQAYQRSIQVNQKTYTMASPDGQVTTFTNMKEHCAKYGLSRFKMSEVVNGHKTQHKGWRALAAPFGGLRRSERAKKPIMHGASLWAYQRCGPVKCDECKLVSREWARSYRERKRKQACQ